nr:chloroplast envelope membrane protein [Actinostachys digitata]
MKIDYWRLIQWLRETPHRSSDRAHKASKQIRFAKKYLYRARVKSAVGRLSESAPTNGFDLLSIIIYWSLLEHRISVFILSIKKKLILFHRSPMSPITHYYRTTASTNMSPNRKNSIKRRKFDPSTFLPHSSNVFFSKLSSRRYLRGGDNGATYVRNRIDDPATADDLGKHMPMRSKKYEQINRKLVWIEAVLNDSVGIEKCAAASPLQSVNKNSNDVMIHKLTNNNLLVSACAYELTNLMPRSINRTLSKFGTELMSQSTPLVLYDFRLAKHQASSSLKTIAIGCLIISSFLIYIILKNEFLKLWVGHLWDTSELPLFFDPFKEEKTLSQFRRAEGLPWLDELTRSSVSLRLQDCDTNINICKENIQFVMMYNNLNTQIVSCVVSDTVSLVTPILLLAISRGRLAALNPWIQELFHSLSDTMKAFSILLVTDSCVGFHSPQGWEIITGCFLEHVGFVRGRYVISCFVSTSPVISDTASKYWIFRHPNRASPSIVATYHTTSE